MGNEIGQLEIPGVQLRESRSQPRVSHSREIGEAEIIHTIFGKAKVRIVRKHDKLRHALLLTATFGVASISTFVAQSWYVAQQRESTRHANPIAPVSVVHDVAPASLPEAASAIPPVAVLESAAPPPKPALPSVPQPQAAKPVPVPVPPKPVVARPPVVASVQVVAPPVAPVVQTTPPAAALKVPPVAPPAVKPTVPKPPAVSVVAVPSEAKPAVQPAASSPVAAPALDAQVIKDGSSGVDNHLSAPISVQSN